VNSGCYTPSLIAARVAYVAFVHRRVGALCGSPTAWLIVLMAPPSWRVVCLPAVSACLVMAIEPPPHKTPAELRAQADHARELAHALSSSDETGRHLRRLADELEAEADALERQTPP
jgi:hypothetical protein